jgi:hypothetical protein
MAPAKRVNAILIDPTVIHARKRGTPVLWGDELFSRPSGLQEQARLGHRVGWAQSSLDGRGVGVCPTID